MSRNELILTVFLGYILPKSFDIRSHQVVVRVAGTGYAASSITYLINSIGLSLSTTNSFQKIIPALAIIIKMKVAERKKTIW